MQSFKAKIDIIGINPFVLLPEKVLNAVFKQAQKDKGPIPVKGKINGHNFIQTLVKYKGEWRLYINGPMLKASDKTVGNSVNIGIEFDPEERKIIFHPKLKAAIDKNKKAKIVFNSLAPSLQKEIIRYIANLKTEETIEKNIKLAVQFLLGKQRWIGRDRP
ncbi:MAG: YdeI/OmpD-associated family protein [Bacteroidia bacterium]|nr:YdeI/OmpD-associated family protein [Bacteroidia bacterium]